MHFQSQPTTTATKDKIRGLPQSEMNTGDLGTCGLGSMRLLRRPTQSELGEIQSIISSLWHRCRP